MSLNSTKNTDNIWIQRFIIFHLGLLPKKRIEKNGEEDLDGQSATCLDESASLEELTEHILYYYDPSDHANRDNVELRNQDDGGNSSLLDRRVSEDALKFSGLCQALYSLPSSLKQAGVENGQGENNNDDGTEEVHLSTSTLVFVLLEIHEKDGILAVIQIPRIYNTSSSNVSDVSEMYFYNGNKKENENVPSNMNNLSSISGGDPRAIRLMIQKYHALFQLTRGGGIHRRLSSYEPEEKLDSSSPLSNGTISNDHSITNFYPGMAEVYALRKQLRMLASLAEKSSHESNGHDNLQTNINTTTSTHDETHPISPKFEETLKQLSALLKSLPISPLRADLKQYYDELLSDISSHHKYARGIGHSIVQALPCPLRNQPNHTLQYPQCFPAAYTVHILSKAMHTLLSSDITSPNTNICEDNKTNKRPKHASYRFFGISSFYCDRLLFSQTKFPEVNISSQTACLVYEYFSSFRQKSTRQKEENRNFFSRTFISTVGNATDTDVEGYFLSPPNASVVSEFENINYLLLPCFGKVWFPEICLEVGDNHVEMMNVYAVVYLHGNWNFILYFQFYDEEVKDIVQHPDNTKNDMVDKNADNHERAEDPFFFQDNESFTAEANVFAQLLYRIAHHISTTILSLNRSDEERNTKKKSSKLFGNISLPNGYSGEPGTDIVYTDRTTNSLVLLSNCKNYSPSGSTTLTKKGKKKMAMSIFENKKMRKKAMDAKMRTRNNEFNLPQVLDCRHALSTRLPLDVMLAFDDMFNEINRLKDRQKCRDPEVGTQRSSVIELCTFLPQGWMYCHAQNSKELYILFDTEMHVTLADVQKVASCVRQKLFKDVLGGR